MTKPLELGSKHNWQVSNPTRTVYSQLDSFTVGSIALSTITLTSPANNVTIDTNFIDFQWEATNVTAFDVYMDNKILATNQSESIGTNQFVYKAKSILVPNSQHSWFVTATGNNSIKSEVRNFISGGNITIELKIVDYYDRKPVSSVWVELNRVAQGSSDAQTLVGSGITDSEGVIRIVYNPSQGLNLQFKLTDSRFTIMDVAGQRLEGRVRVVPLTLDPVNPRFEIGVSGMLCFI